MEIIINIIMCINQMIEWSGAQKNTQGVYKGHITS